MVILPCRLRSVPLPNCSTRQKSFNILSRSRVAGLKDQYWRALAMVPQSTAAGITCQATLKALQPSTRQVLPGAKCKAHKGLPTEKTGKTETVGFRQILLYVRETAMRPHLWVKDCRPVGTCPKPQLSRQVECACFCVLMSHLVELREYACLD